MSVIAITDQIDRARVLLDRPIKAERSAPALGAALLAAVTALLLAGAVILGPGVESPRPATTTTTTAQ